MRTGAFPTSAAAEHCLEVGQVALSHHHPPVADTSTHHRSLEAVGLSNSPGGHEATLAPTSDTESVAISHALIDQHVDAIRNVDPVIRAHCTGDLIREPVATPETSDKAE